MNKLNLLSLQGLVEPITRTLLIITVPLLLLSVINRLLLPSGAFIRAVGYHSYAQRWNQLHTLKHSRGKGKRGIVLHLDQLTRSLSRNERNSTTLLQRFIVWTVCAFLFNYFIYGWWTGLLISFKWNHLFDRWMIITSLLASVLPYCFMRLRLHRIRVNNSYDLVPAVQMLSLKYAEHKGNLYYAIYETAQSLKGDIQKAFVGLLPALQGASGASVEEAVALFIYRIKTTWAIQLGIFIQKSEEHGDRIDEGLQKLILDMSEVAQITEEIKSDNRETIQMAYLPAILLPAVIYLNQYPSMGKSWHYYFGTIAGVRMLVWTVLFTFVCAVVAYTIQKPRNEV